jgi:hypothetical protein
VRLWPTTVLTPDDWIADVAFSNGTTYRLGVSAHLSEQAAMEQVRAVLSMRNKARHVVEVRLRRRTAAYRSVEEMHIENRMRLVK